MPNTPDPAVAAQKAAIVVQPKLQPEDVDSDWLDIIAELEGCLATGLTGTRDINGDFAIAGGTSRPAYVHAYNQISPAIDAAGADLVIRDIAN